MLREGFSICIKTLYCAIFFIGAGGHGMSITVRIPSPLRQYSELHSEVVLEGKTVGEVLENLKTRFPEMGTRCFTPRTSRFMNLYLNDQDIKNLNNLDTPVRDKDTLSIVFAIAGG
jgi:molybdopterin converting factor small subunit